MIFVDTNVLIDIFEPGEWSGWSEAAVASGRAEAELVSSHIVLAELAAAYSAVEMLRQRLSAFGIRLLVLDDGAAFRAGRAHAIYRKAGGLHRAILANFLIGGHAVSLGARLLTRDRQRFASYFPELALITPETDHG